MKSEAPVAWPLALLATVLAYAGCGLLALLVAIPPGYATPLYPSAGVALVSVLVAGPRMLPGVWLGSFLVNASLAGARADAGPVDLVLPAVIGVGAMLQAWVASLLVRRMVGEHPELSEPREVARFFVFGAALACLVSSSIAVTALSGAGAIDADHVARTWATWWLGDALGTVIAGPILLTLVGRPRSAWRSRRRSVALPLLLVTLLAGIAIAHARRWDEGRAMALFERDVATAHSAVMWRLQQPLDALEAIRSLFVASDDVSALEFRQATRNWTQMPNAPQALGFSQALRAADVPAFVQAMRREHALPYRVFDRGADGTPVPTPADEVLAIRYIEPMAANAKALGVNTLSIPAAREAVERARRSDLPAATAGFRLTQEAADQTGVVVYAPLVSPKADGPSGVVFVSLRMQDVLQPALERLPGYLQVCLEDVDGEQSRLGGSAECDRIDAMRFHRLMPFEFAQRRWALHVGTADGAALGLGHQDTWLFAIVALLAAGTFGALLLTMTGRARRIETAVVERTAALQREIGERTRTETALRESEQRFRNILNHVPIGVLYTDLQGGIKLTNPKFRELVGIGAEQLRRMRASDFAHPDDVEEERRLIQRLVDGELTVFQRQQRIVRGDGQVLSVRSIVSLLRDADGRPHRIVGTVEDITEHLQLEEAQAGREMAEAANRAKNEFLSRMSHELRTPLNAMLGFAQLIELDRQQPLSKSQRDWVGQIQTAGWHLLEMINDTLDLSRIESGTLKLDIEAMDLKTVVEASLAMVERSAQARGISLALHIAPAAAQVTGDATRVKQVLTNLLTNAVKYNVDGGSVRVEADTNLDGEVEISIADTGLGMNAAQLAALFQPFNRLGRERSSQEGTGIGLVISQRLAELMGGRLMVRSSEGQGSTFTLALPRAMSRAGAIDVLSQPDPEPEYHQRIVHYIEDNETNAVVMQGILAQRPQVRLRVSASGLEGLAAVRARPPSLILLDMHLPDIDGLQLLRLLKDDLVTAAVPVVAVSADAVESRIRAASEIGAEHYLTKPVNVAELLRIVDEVLEAQDTLFG